MIMVGLGSVSSNFQLSSWSRNHWKVWLNLLFRVVGRMAGESGIKANLSLSLSWSWVQLSWVEAELDKNIFLKWVIISQEIVLRHYQCCFPEKISYYLTFLLNIDAVSGWCLDTGQFLYGVWCLETVRKVCGQCLENIRMVQWQCQ